MTPGQEGFASYLYLSGIQ